MLWLLSVDFGGFEDFDCPGGGGNEVALLALGFFDGKTGDRTRLDDVSNEGDLSWLVRDDCEAEKAS